MEKLRPGKINTDLPNAGRKQMLDGIAEGLRKAKETTEKSNHKQPRQIAEESLKRIEKRRRNMSIAKTIGAGILRSVTGVSLLVPHQKFDLKQIGKEIVDIGDCKIPNPDIDDVWSHRLAIILRIVIVVYAIYQFSDGGLF